MGKFNFTGNPLSSLQLAGLFVFFIILTAGLAFAAIVIGQPLYVAGSLSLMSGFYESWAWVLAFGLCGSLVAYMLYRLKRVDAPYPIARWLAPLSAAALTMILLLALQATVFALTRIVLIGAALTVIALILSRGVPAAWRPLPLALAGFCGSVALILIPVESILLHRYVKNIAILTGSGQVLDFYGIVDEQARAPGNLKPNLDATLMLGDGSTGRVITNALGFRNTEELRIPKPVDEFRILFLGDSFTYGYRTDQSRSAVHVMETRLRERLNRNVRIYPAWVGNQAGLLEWLRSYPEKFQADMILHGICLGNDLRTSLLAQNPAARADGSVWLDRPIPAEYLDLSRYERDDTFIPGTEMRTMRRQLRIAQTMRLLFSPSPISTGKPIPRGAPPMWNTQNDIGVFIKDLTNGDELFALLGANLSAAKKLSGETPFHAILFPQRFQQSKREWEAQVRYYGLNAESFDLDGPNRRLAEICAEQGLACLDLLPAFRSRGDEILHYPYDMHWNDAGNRLAGEAMADYLLEALHPAVD